MENDNPSKCNQAGVVVIITSKIDFKTQKSHYTLNKRRIREEDITNGWEIVECLPGMGKDLNLVSTP